jgi:hypothetical protein
MRIHIDIKYFKIPQYHAELSTSFSESVVEFGFRAHAPEAVGSAQAPEVAPMFENSIIAEKSDPTLRRISQKSVKFGRISSGGCFAQ